MGGPGLDTIRSIGRDKAAALSPSGLRGAALSQQDFLNADLTGMDLSGATFRDCELRAAVRLGKP